MVPPPLVFVLENIRDQLIKSGAKAIEQIVKAKKKLDIENRISKQDFDAFIAKTGVHLNDVDRRSLIQTYETQDRSHIRFLDFLWGVREKLNNFREKLVIAAFKKLDQHKDDYVTHARIKEVYNAKCHPAVMLERFNVHEVTDAFLVASFANLEHVTLHDFLEYYALTSNTIACDKRFELLIMKHWKVTPDGVSVEDIENKVKLVVYKNRIRSREFMRDFDKLRGRLISETQFASALDNSSVELTPREVKALCDNYRVPEDAQMRVCWTAFCDEIDTVFTFKGLEKTPWREPPPVPELPGLAPQRFEQGIIDLGPKGEARAAQVLEELRTECRRRRISMRGFFDDFASNRNSSKAVGHVTKQQFFQALAAKANLHVSNEDAKIIAAKFDDLGNGMVNYVAFSVEVDPYLKHSNGHELHPHLHYHRK